MLLVVAFLPGTAGAAFYYVEFVYHPCGGRTPAVLVRDKSNITDGVKFEFTATTSEVLWDDVTVKLSVLTSFQYQKYEEISWKNISASALTSWETETWHYGRGKDLHGLTMFLNVTDIAGNGRMSNGDYLTFTVGCGVFEPGDFYVMTVFYEPTCGPMLEYEFTI